MFSTFFDSLKKKRKKKKNEKEEENGNRKPQRGSVCLSLSLSRYSWLSIFFEEEGKKNKKENEEEEEEKRVEIQKSFARFDSCFFKERQQFGAVGGKAAERHAQVEVSLSGLGRHSRVVGGRGEKNRGVDARDAAVRSSLVGP